MKFAYLIMGKYDSNVDRAALKEDKLQVIGVSDLDNACEVAIELCKSGVDCIEVCGAFGEKGVKRLIEATENRIAIGHITHLPEQDEIFRATFSKKK